MWLGGGIVTFCAFDSHPISTQNELGDLKGLLCKGLFSSKYNISWKKKAILHRNILSWHLGWDPLQFQFSSVQSLSHVRLFATPWTAACQASLSITNSWSSPKPMFIELVMPSNHLILCPLLLRPSIFPSIRVFSMNQLFTSGGQSIGVSASTSVLPINTQGWSPLGWTGWISLQSKGFSRVFSNTTVQKHQFFGAQLSSQSNSHIHTWPLEKP